ncbi:SprT-like domain-containing protein [Herbiconiux sp. KACC 21604]|uniref:SprT-like domain-containing protein n=1 Tax=unclassified Herbiconiux TaxID=2618217 RepID=UPI001492684B|nr:SprT-like domain-containing protein [Herbiconiux sp. SALV-R1]QJU52382.1 M48 family peptidase [Herbiconiux sp. SALV-R1]WPO87244.1 SprT-like domain-containing protein [Herbiconiux sp. KACC 21604]
MADLQRVTRWANALIALHLDARVWSFGFDNAKTRAGQCNYTAHRITVSRYLAARYEDDEIHQILLHEVAHALAGPAAAHGPRWVAVAREIGYEGSRLHDGERADELAPWIGHCPAGHEYFRHRRPKNRVSCSVCARGFSSAHLIVWTRRDVAATRRAIHRAAR